MDYFIRAPDFFRKEPHLMKLTFPVTKERIRNHFAYAWWQYVLLICLAIFGWNLLYTTTATAAPTISGWNGSTAAISWMEKKISTR